jgi:tripartite-type tricarboxylate transporter receptor subunit TctC
VTAPRRIAVLPEVPAAAERVPGFAIAIWYGMLGPRATPPEVVQRIAAAIAPLRQGTAVSQRMEASGMTVLLDGPAPLAARLAAEVPQWKQLAGSLNLRAE